VNAPENDDASLLDRIEEPQQSLGRSATQT
jgi:hypothetical protein